MIDIPGIYVGRFKDDPNQSTMLMQIGDTPAYTDDNWANVESTGTIWRYNAKAGEWVDTGLEEILVEEVSGTKEIVAEGTVPWKLQGLNVYGKSMQQTTTGRNLLPWTPFETVTRDGVTYECISDGVIRVTGTATANSDSPTMDMTGLLLAPGTYCMISSDINGLKSQFVVRKAATGQNFWYSPTSIVIEEGDQPQYFYVVNQAVGVPVDALVYAYLQTGEGPVASANFESYTGAAPSPSPTYPQPINTVGTSGNITVTVSDGADENQQLNIQTPNGLPGIPVDSGGNYTDADGQQWVCDEVDFACGVYVQRIQKILSYSDENVLSPYMSTTGQLTTGATVIYVLTAPIETPLSAEELAAYAALMSYDGSTVISTDEDVSGISAKVVTDVISKNAWFDPYAELALYYKALAGFESIDNLPMPHSRESSLVRKLLDSSYELGFSVNENSSRNERYLWDLINGTSTMLTNVPKSDTEKFLHVMIGGTVEEYPVVDTELDYWMDKCVHYMNSNGNIGG